MSLSSLYLSWVDDLPPRLNRVTKTRNIAVAMDDGVVLSTDHYAPRSPGPHPTILMRLPYGRRGFGPIAEAYAERGFHVVLQACRGTEKSGGAFDPLTNERADGLATLAWIEQQPWYDGRIGLTGPSYLGYAQWAISDALPATAAMATKVTTADFRSVVFPGGAFHLGLWLSWLQVIEGLRNRPLATAARMFSGDIERRTAAAAMTLPLIEADRQAVGRKVPFWRHWFEHSVANDAFWAALNHRPRLGPRTPPVHFISGWYDFMLDELLADYQRLVDFGHTPYLTIGTWSHIAEELQRDNLRETIIWMRAHLDGDRTGLREKPVRIHVSGRDQWLEFDHYPPPGARFVLWHVGPGGALTPEPPAAPTADRYRYDPADPTPNLGGATFAFTGAGAVDNALREVRDDVLCYTGAPLEADLTIVGQVRVHLRATAAVPDVDFFLRLCDVGPDGVSINICDKLVRVTPDTPRHGEGWRLSFHLHATAHTFRAGHRLRLQVSSGAHPRYARNLGTSEPVGTATTMVVNEVTIIHDGTLLELPAYALPAATPR